MRRRTAIIAAGLIMLAGCGSPPAPETMPSTVVRLDLARGPG
ncbi:hypothetical protein ACFQO7_05985 [Catellatospora aurea]|uniref:Uncharacterized protein n=1 Tax=Catellatospora aurea TaxID=1337874 RepID=A0ABW2GPQ5_9ACTN